MKFEIYKRLAALSRPNNGWTKELNLISWNDREPVYDVRSWNQDHTRCGRGVTLTARELLALKTFLQGQEVL